METVAKLLAALRSAARAPAVWWALSLSLAGTAALLLSIELALAVAAWAALCVCLAALYGAVALVITAGDLVVMVVCLVPWAATRERSIAPDALALDGLRLLGVLGRSFARFAVGSFRDLVRPQWSEAVEAGVVLLLVAGVLALVGGGVLLRTKSMVSKTL